MPTDKFKISGSESTIPNIASGSLFHMMQEAINIFVLSEKDEFEDALKFEDTLETADQIIIDGKLVWDRAATVGKLHPKEWDPQAQIKFQAVKNAYQDFSQFESQILKTCLYGLNRSVARSAQQIIDQNYKFHDDLIAKEEFLSFMCDYPPNSFAKLKLERKNLVFSYALTTLSRLITDGNKFYELNIEGNLKNINSLSECNDSPVIFTMTVMAQLDLNGFPKPKVTFEINITSNHPKFEYHGPSNSFGNIQLDISSITSLLPGSESVKEKPPSLLFLASKVVGKNDNIKINSLSLELEEQIKAYREFKKRRERSLKLS